MKICDLTQAYTGTSGGIRTYIHAKREYLDAIRGGKHILIVPGDRDEVASVGPHTEYRIASPFIPGCEPYRIILALDKVAAILKKECPDLIELGCAYTLPWAAFRHRKTVACAVAGFYHTDFPTTYVEPVVTKYMGKGTALTARAVATGYARLVYGKCDIVFAPSCILRRKLMDYGVGEVVYLPLGVDTGLFSPEKRSLDLRRSLGVADDEIMLIYTGRIDMEKQVDVIADAYRLLPKTIAAKLLLVGDGPLVEAITQGSEGGRTIIHKPFTTSKEELAALLASSDIYVTAGPYETFGLSVLEAQASGLPVVGVRAGALIERVTSDLGLLGAPGSPNEMAMNILALAGNGIKERGITARRMVETTYSWPRTFDQLFGWYERAIREVFKRPASPETTGARNLNRAGTAAMLSRVALFTATTPSPIQRV